MSSATAFTLTSILAPVTNPDIRTNVGINILIMNIETATIAGIDLHTNTDINVLVLLIFRLRASTTIIISNYINTKIHANLTTNICN